MWGLLSRLGAEFYRRFITSLDEFQNVRAVDTGEIVPDLERGEMYTYQLRVYNISNSSPIKNARAKLRINSGYPGVKAKTETTLCWAPTKGEVTINRGDHEWLNLATVRAPQEETLWGKPSVAEVIFPTEAGVLNPSTIEITRESSEESPSESVDSVTRQSLPLNRVPWLLDEGNLKVSSANRPLRHYSYSVFCMNEEVRVTVNTYRKGWRDKLVKQLFDLTEFGMGAGVQLDELGERAQPQIPEK